MVEKKDRLKNIEDNFRELHRKIDVFVRDVQNPLKEQLKDKGKKVGSTSNKPAGENTGSGRSNDNFSKQIKNVDGSIKTLNNTIGQFSTLCATTISGFDKKFDELIRIINSSTKAFGASNDVNSAISKIGYLTDKGKQQFSDERDFKNLTQYTDALKKILNTPETRDGLTVEELEKYITEAFNKSFEEDIRLANTYGKKYLYEKDNEGNIVLDENGIPKRQKRKNGDDRMVKIASAKEKKDIIANAKAAQILNGDSKAKENIERRKANDIRKAWKGFEDVLFSSIEIFMAWKEASLDIMIESERTKWAIAQQQFGVISKSINTTIKNAFSGITNGKLIDQVYNNANNVIEQIGAFEKLRLDKELKSFQYQKKVTETRMKATSQTIKSAGNIVQGSILGVLGVKSYKKVAGKAAGKVVAKTAAKTAAKTGAKAIGGAILKGAAVGSAGGPMGIVAGVVAELGIQALKKVTSVAYDNWMKIQMKKLELGEEELKGINEYKKGIVDTISEGAKQVLELSKNVEEYQGSIDKYGKELATVMGYSGTQLQNFTNRMFESADAVAVFNKKAEDLYKIQNAYVDTSERNVVLNESDQMSTFALGRSFGISDDEAARISGNMNIFNIGVSNANDRMFSMFKTANKWGLSVKKFSKDLLNNLKMAQKYDFKGGVDGVMKMSLWAQKTRFDMNQLGGMLDKLRTGNIEDSFKMAGEMNVLGGNAAAMSDPLGMLADAWGDPEALANRMVDSVKGFGKIDKLTGETKFGIGESMRIKRIAEAYGYDEASLKNIVREKNKRDAIRNATGTRFNDEQLIALGSKATYNKDNGKWEVNLVGEEKARDITTLSPEDFNKLVPEDNIEALVKYAKDSLDVLTRQEALMLGEKTSIGVAAKRTFYGESDIREKNQKDWFDTNKSGLIGEVVKGQKFATESQRIENKNMEANMQKHISDLYMKYMTEQSKQYEAQMGLKAEEMQILLQSMGGDLIANEHLNKIAGEATGIKNIIERTSGVKYGNREVNAERNKKSKTRQRDIDKIYEINNKDGFGIFGNGWSKKKIAKKYDAGELSYDEDGTVWKTNKHRRAKAIGGTYQGADTKEAIKAVKDGIGLNGGNVVSVNDGFGRLNRPITRLGNGNTMVGHPDDNVIMAKPDGPISKAVNAALGLRPVRDYNSGRMVSRTYGGSNNIKIDNQINGTLTLKTTDGQKVDLMKLVNENSGAFRDMVNKAIDDSGRKLWKVIKDENNFYDNNGRPSGYVYR